MLIRKALSEDKERLGEIYSILFHEMSQLQPLFYKEAQENQDFLDEILQSLTACIFVAENFAGVIGFVLVLEQITLPYPCIYQHKYAYLVDMAVLPQHRGQGAGSKLIQEVKKWASDRHLHHIALNVLEENTDAINMYEQNSFRTVMRTMRFVL